MIFRQLSGALAEDSCYLSSTSTSVPGGVQAYCRIEALSCISSLKFEYSFDN